MSIALIKSLLDGQDIKTTSLSIGFEFNRKSLNYALLKKLIETNKNKRVIIINFDVVLYKYILYSDLKDIKVYSNTSNITGGNTILFNIADKSKEIYNSIFAFKPHMVIIAGLDLLSSTHIHNFFKFNKINLTSQLNIFLSSLDDSFMNLNDDIEEKGNIIRSKLNILISERTSKVNNTKLLVYSEFTNFTKLTKDIGIFEYNMDSNATIPVYLYQFEKINVYLKEFKDIFEVLSEEGITIEPISTFKLTLNEKELQAKNEVILPYLNKDKPKITIDQDDLNELYEEDPDGDLDI
jgi:hypothetical protein